MLFVVFENEIINNKKIRCIKMNLLVEWRFRTHSDSFRFIKQTLLRIKFPTENLVDAYLYLP